MNYFCFFLSRPCYFFTPTTHCNPLQGQFGVRTGFSLCSISTQGNLVFISWDPCNENRFFPDGNTTQEKTLFSLQGWVYSAGENMPHPCFFDGSKFLGWTKDFEHGPF